MTAIRTISVAGASFYSTHHASPADLLAGLDRAATPPAFALLVGRARRFTSLATQLHVEVCGALGLDPATRPPTVFATCHGEIQTAELLIADFHQNALVSSARFALSVHNTPSGLYSVATESNAPSTTITGDNALAAGWLEAALTALELGAPVLLSIADEAVPAVFAGPDEPAGVAAAFLVAPGGGTGRSVELAIVPSTGDPVTMPHALARAVDAWRTGEPASIRLGFIQPGSELELRLPAGGVA